jgi:hypothetical protein
MLSWMGITPRIYSHATSVNMFFMGMAAFQVCVIYNGHPKAKDAFKECTTPDPCLLVKGQRHQRFPGVPRTISHQIRWRVTGLPTALDSFNAIPRQQHRGHALCSHVF